MSTIRKQIRDGLASYFTANWEATGIAYANKAFEPEIGTPYVRFTLLFAGSERRTMTGSPASGQLHYGSAIIQVFTPAGEGDGEAMTLADAVAGLFSEKQIPLSGGGEIVTTVPQTSIVGNEGDWFQVNVQCPFEHLT